MVLRLGNPMFVGDLQHWNGNTFLVQWRYRFYDKACITFDVNALDEPSRLAFADLPNQYERAPSGNATTAAQ
jgi:hypothetical protein